MLRNRGIAWRLKNNRLLSWIRFNRYLGPLWSRIQWYDDFSWDTYTRDSYYQQLTQEIEAGYTTQLSKVPFSVRDGKIELPEDVKPIHPKHLVIYKAVLALTPDSLFEFGFGGGDQLANFRVLLPRAELGGVDIGDTQRQLALQRNERELTDPDAPVWLDIRDMTLANAADDLADRAEFVYCQAVLMHIHGADRHRRFIANMWKVSRRYVMIVENWARHDYVEDLQSLFPSTTLYVVEHGGVTGLLLDKQNALPYASVQTDKQLRDMSLLV